jgi:hypothetical protein
VGRHEAAAKHLDRDADRNSKGRITVPTPPLITEADIAGARATDPETLARVHAALRRLLAADAQASAEQGSAEQGSGGLDVQ